MKVTRKDLEQWIEKNLTITYNNEHYKVRHQGLAADGKPNGYDVRTKRYFLMRVGVGSGIGFYHKGAGVYGLTTNRYA